MARETPQLGLPESVHGVDYLIDYYQLIGVERDADSATIKKAWQIKIQQYHSDRFQGLAEELASQAEQKTMVLIEADQILSDSEKRKEYDYKLTNWEGPISTSGLPVIVLGISRFAQTSVLGKLDAQNKALDHNLKKGALMVGFDQTTFDFIEQQYRSTRNPNAQLREAYRQALAKKDTYIGLQELLYRESVGIREPTEMTKQYLGAVTQDLARERERISGDVANLVLKLTGGDVRLIGSGGDEHHIEFSDQPTRAIEHYTQTALQRFDETAQVIEDLAGERERLITERLRVLEGDYRSSAKDIFNRGIIEIVAGDAKNYFEFQIEGTNIKLNQANDQESLATESEEELQKLFDQGYNFVSIIHQDGLPLMDELTAVIGKHFELLNKRKKGKKKSKAK